MTGSLPWDGFQSFAEAFYDELFKDCAWVVVPKSAQNASKVVRKSVQIGENYAARLGPVSGRAGGRVVDLQQQKGKRISLIIRQFCITRQ